MPPPIQSTMSVSALASSDFGWLSAATVRARVAPPAIVAIEARNSRRLQGSRGSVGMREGIGQFRFCDFAVLYVLRFYAAIFHTRQSARSNVTRQFAIVQEKLLNWSRNLR